MRQAGIIAAAGIVALEKMIDRLEEDHRNARLLAEDLVQIDGLHVDLRRVQTNMVLCDVDGLGISADEFVKELKKNGVLINSISGSRVRFVTHRGIESEDIERALSIIENVTRRISAENKG